ncbi:MAG: hypothetical protein ACYDB2_07510 [Acidimicrobiales bacterium]
MALKRGDSIPRPNPWILRAADLSAAKGWDALVAQFLEAADKAWVAVTKDPRHHDDRQHQLRGSLGTVTVAGRALEQWEYEVTSGSRLRYAIDDTERTLWITHAGVSHPKDTDTTRRRKRG